MSKIQDKGTVWVSDIIRKAITARMLTVPESELNNPDQEEITRIADKYCLGLPLGDNERPAQAYAFPGERIESLPDLFMISEYGLSRYIIVSSALVDILRMFDLGDGGLHPIELFQGDRIERIGGDWFLVNFGCQKQAFLPEWSTGNVTPFSDRPPLQKWRIGALKHNGLVLLDEAQEGSDLWIDTGLRNALFLSDRLRKAIARSKLADGVRCFRCFLVKPNSFPEYYNSSFVKKIPKLYPNFVTFKRKNSSISEYSAIDMVSSLTVCVIGDTRKEYEPGTVLVAYSFDGKGLVYIPAKKFKYENERTFYYINISDLNQFIYEIKNKEFIINNFQTYEKFIEILLYGWGECWYLGSLNSFFVSDI